MRSVGKLALLMFGLFLFGLGTVLAIHSDLGSSPWDTLHRGLAGRTGLTLGQVTQALGAVILLADIALGQIPGRATVLNMYFVGFFIDEIERYSLVPSGQSLPVRIAMLFAGIIAIGWGSFFYMNTGWGAGPRDSLMLGLSRVFGTQVWKARTAVEAFAAAGGLLLGVKLGFGTLAIVLLVGPAVEFAFRVSGKDPKETVHQTLADDWHRATSYLHGSRETRSL